MTKMVAAVVAMQLVEEGKLSLDDTVSRHLPGVLPEASKITIRQLLNHTSGIPDYLSDPQAPIQGSVKRLLRDLATSRTQMDAIRTARRLPRPFEPGAAHDYSNTNYVILQRIMERLEGKSFSRIVNRRLIRPLGLSKTGFPNRQGRFPPSVMRAYLSGQNGQRPALPSVRLHDVTRHTFYLGADGGLYSNGVDLLRLLDAIWRGPLLAEKQRELLTRGLVEDHDGQIRYGLGIMAFATTCGRIVYGHEGRDFGSFTMVLTDRVRSRHLVFFTNLSIDDIPGADRMLAEVRDAVFCNNQAT